MGKGAKNKAYIKVVETGEIKKFQYNPTDYSDSQSFNYSMLDSICGSYPMFTYTGTGELTFSIKVYVYGTQGEPQSFIDFFDSLKPKGRFDMPKQVIFAFGKYVKKCIITQIKRDFKQFNEDLSPTEMVFDLSFTEV